MSPEFKTFRRPFFPFGILKVLGPPKIFFRFETFEFGYENLKSPPASIEIVSFADNGIRNGLFYLLLSFL